MAPSDTLRECAERLAQRPGDAEAIAVLEGFLQSSERAQAARTLAPVYERLNNTAGLLTTLGIIVETSAQPLEQLACLKRIARVYRDLHQPLLALPVLTKAIGLSPPDPALYRLTEDVAVEAGAIASLAEQLASLSSRLPGA